MYFDTSYYLTFDVFWVEFFPPHKDGESRKHHDIYTPDTFPKCLPKQILFSELASGKRPCAVPHHWFKDQLENTLLRTEINPVNWDMEASERTNWRTINKKKKHLKYEESPKKSQSSPPPKTLLSYHAVIVDVFLDSI